LIDEVLAFHPVQLALELRTRQSARGIEMKAGCFAAAVDNRSKDLDDLLDGLFGRWHPANTHTKR